MLRRRPLVNDAGYAGGDLRGPGVDCPLVEAFQQCLVCLDAVAFGDATKLGLSIIEAGLAEVGVEVGVDSVGGHASVFKFGACLRSPPGQLRSVSGFA